MPLPTTPPMTPAATAVGALRLVRRPGSGEYLESERGAAADLGVRSLERWRTIADLSGALDEPGGAG